MAQGPLHWAITHQHKVKFWFVWPLDDARTGDAGQPPVETTGGQNQALGSALMRADKRDSLRPTVLA